MRLLQNSINWLSPSDPTSTLACPCELAPLLASPFASKGDIHTAPDAFASAVLQWFPKWGKPKTLGLSSLTKKGQRGKGTRNNHHLESMSRRDLKLRRSA